MKPGCCLDARCGATIDHGDTDAGKPGSQDAARKRIALVAHDHKKHELIEWAKWNRVGLATHELFATGTSYARWLPDYADYLDRSVQADERRIARDGPS